MSEEGGSTLPRRQLGRYLREAREGIGMTLVESSRLIEWSKSKLQRLVLQPDFVIGDSAGRWAGRRAATA